MLVNIVPGMSTTTNSQVVLSNLSQRIMSFMNEVSSDNNDSGRQKINKFINKFAFLKKCNKINSNIWPI